MALPMSILRVAMKDVGFTSRQSLTVMELHFVGMWATGFVAGSLIQLLGVPLVCVLGVVFSSIGVALAFISKPESDGSIASWYFTMISIGMGWNFSFSAATVWLVKAVSLTEYSKTQIQSANDSLMFFFLGVWILSAGSIYEAGGSYLEGWQTLNYAVVGLIALYAVVFSIDTYLCKTADTSNQDTEPHMSQQEE